MGWGLVENVEGIFADIGLMTELRIHDYTERGNNDSIKQGGNGLGTTITGKCCDSA